MSGRKLRQVLRERGGKLLCGVEFTNKAEITPSELKAMEDLLKASDQRYTQEGRALNRNEAKYVPKRTCNIRYFCTIPT